MNKTTDSSDPQLDPAQQAQGEIRVLKQAISALRDEMETMEASSQQKVQKRIGIPTPVAVARRRMGGGRKSLSRIKALFSEAGIY